MNYKNNLCTANKRSKDRLLRAMSVKNSVNALWPYLSLQQLCSSEGCEISGSLKSKTMHPMRL